MRWSERQLAMLREMGIRVWAPEAPAAMEDQAPRRWSRNARRRRRPGPSRCRWRGRLRQAYERAGSRPAARVPSGGARGRADRAGGAAQR